jgi:Zn-dependent protease
MTFAFAIAYIGGARNLESYFRLGGGLLVLLVLTGSFVAVVTAFFLHELAHKAVAQRCRAVAEYHYSPAGLLAGLVTVCIGWMLAMPGAAVISGRITPQPRVRISVAGPATNLASADVFIGLSVALGTTPGRFREPIPIFIGTLAFVNLLLAGFNLNRVPPIAFHRKIAGRLHVNVTLPASEGFLILVPSEAVWAISVVALLALGIGGRMLAVF